MVKTMLFNELRVGDVFMYRYDVADSYTSLFIITEKRDVKHDCCFLAYSLVDMTVDEHWSDDSSDVYGNPCEVVLIHRLTESRASTDED